MVPSTLLHSCLWAPFKMQSYWNGISILGENVSDCMWARRLSQDSPFHMLGAEVCSLQPFYKLKLAAHCLVVKGAGSYVANCMMRISAFVVCAYSNPDRMEKWEKRDYNMTTPYWGLLSLCLSLCVSVSTCTLRKLKKKKSSRTFKCFQRTLSEGTQF